MPDRRREGGRMSPEAATFIASLSPMAAGVPAHMFSSLAMPSPGVTAAALRRLVRAAGDSVSGFESSDKFFSGKSEAKKAIIQMLRGNAFFDPDTRRVVYSREAYVPGVLAHEVGHGLNMASLGRGLMALPRMAAGAGIPLGVLGAVMSRDERTGGAAALAGTLAGLPMLGEEALASARGYSLLPRNIPLRGRLAAFIGLPTYLAAAASPELIHRLRSALGGYDKTASAMEKNAWIFSLPMGAAPVPADVTSVPKYTLQALKGPNREDTTPRLRSLGLAGLGAVGALFGLGFTGLGLRGLGSKLGVLAARRAGRRVPAALRGVAREMDVPAYVRHAESLGWPGRITGGIAHPFNKLEDAITRGVEKVLGSRAAGAGSALAAAGSGLERFPGVSMSMSPWVVAPWVAGSMALQPDPSPEDLMRARYMQIYGDSSI